MGKLKSVGDKRVKALLKTGWVQNGSHFVHPDYKPIALFSVYTRSDDEWAGWCNRQGVTDG